MLRFNHLIKKQNIFNKHHIPLLFLLLPWPDINFSKTRKPAFYQALLKLASALGGNLCPDKTCLALQKQNNTKESPKVIYFSQVRIVLFWKRLKSELCVL